MGIADTCPLPLVTQVEGVVDLTLRAMAVDAAGGGIRPKLLVVAAGVIVVADVQKRDRIFGADVDEVRSCARTLERVGDVDVVVVAVAVDAEEPVVVVSIFDALKN